MRAAGADALVVPFAADSDGAVFSPALQSSVVNARVARFASASYSLSPGLRYSRSCADAGYTDTASGACSNFSDPASFQCALGAGDSCSECPSNSLCPGGKQQWPRPGFFAFSETDTNFQVGGVNIMRKTAGSTSFYTPYFFTCRSALLPTPSHAVSIGTLFSTLLCVDRRTAKVASAATLVVSRRTRSVAYLRALTLRNPLAANQYYLDGTGDCLACPRNLASWDSYSGLVNILAAAIGLVAVAYVLFALLARYYGGSVFSTMGHAGQLFAWAVLMLQGLAQVATVTSQSLPPTISRMFISVSRSRGSCCTLPAILPSASFAPRSSPCSTFAGSSSPRHARVSIHSSRKSSQWAPSLPVWLSLPLHLSPHCAALRERLSSTWLGE